MSKVVVKLCWFHARLEQYMQVFSDLDKIIVENVGGDFDSCVICQKYGKLKDVSGGVA